MAHTYLNGGYRPSDGRGGGGGLKNLFLALPASVWSRDKGMGGGGAPLDPPLYLAHIWEYLGI